MTVLRVRVCQSCALKEDAIAAMVHEIQTCYDDRVVFQSEECLDLCDLSPATIVGATPVAPTTARLLREAIENRLNSKVA